MRVVLLYRPNSEHSRMVEVYTKEYERQRGQVIELISLDTIDGSDMARLYGIVQYPALLALRDDGQLMKDWQGNALPLSDEVSGYLSR